MKDKYYFLKNMYEQKIIHLKTSSFVTVNILVCSQILLVWQVLKFRELLPRNYNHVFIDISLLNAAGNTYYAYM